MPNAPIVASPFTTSSGIRASRSMSAPSTEVSQNSRIRAQNSSPRRTASASGRGCGWIRPSWKSPRYNCLPKLGFCHPDSLASSATWRASRSPTFRVCPVSWVLIAHPISLGGPSPDTAPSLPGGNTTQARCPSRSALRRARLDRWRLTHRVDDQGAAATEADLFGDRLDPPMAGERQPGGVARILVQRQHRPRGQGELLPELAGEPLGEGAVVANSRGCPLTALGPLTPGAPLGPGGCGSAWNRQACPLGVVGARGLVVEPDPALGKVAEVKTCSPRQR